MPKFFTPTGHEIKEYESIVGDFTPKSYGDVMTREQWFDCDFIPYDGTLGEIVIDGKLTCYELKGWASEFYLFLEGERVYFDFTEDKNFYRVKLISTEEFKALEGDVQVCWYNR